MFKANKLLKVISIILIVFGAFGLISNVIALAVPAQAIADAGITIPMSTRIIGWIGIAVELAAGIIGVAVKDAKIVMVAAIAYLGLTVISIVVSAISGSFTVISLIGLILPALYFWGYYQSK